MRLMIDLAGVYGLAHLLASNLKTSEVKYVSPASKIFFSLGISVADAGGRRL